MSTMAEEQAWEPESLASPASTLSQQVTSGRGTEPLPPQLQNQHHNSISN